ncbi:MAG: 3-methylcrotonyl-CoA carboxylase, partial [Burkholderiales bacterium]|nr:3-methylcrotonyl-CoA carboxylase [Burkholderiales bacterium]
EFIVNQDGSFYFMEMNTRLQVEHPVTEMITGQDLVEWQLRVAAGEHLPLSQSELQLHGHAIEARVYAENPEKGFLPAIGTLHHMRMPQAVNFELGVTAGKPASVRIDAGVREGDTISPFYDPMIAKLIVWGEDRKTALARMSQALAQYQIVGLASNIGFLQRVVKSTAFANADLDTGLIERNQAELFPPLQACPVAAIALAAVSLVLDERKGVSSSDPWSQPGGWRLNSRLQRQLEFSDEYSETQGLAYQAKLTYCGEVWELSVAGVTVAVELADQYGPNLYLKVGERTVHGSVVRVADNFHVFFEGKQIQLQFNDPMQHADEGEGDGGRLTAPMPGKVVAVLAQAGQEVKKGEPLLIMEAMKMEHTIAAPHDGIVEEVLYNVGDQVADGVPLLAFQVAS